jgi:peptide/nickel transport system permease protein
MLALFYPLIAPYDPKEPTGDFLVAPSAQHWFGTTRDSRDILTLVMAAARTDLSIALSSAVLSLCLGTSLGVVAGYSRGIVGEIVSRVFDVIQAFPFFILALLLLTAIGPSIPNIIAVISVVNAPIYLRLLKSQTLHLRERTFIEAAKVAGNSEWSVMFRHLLPNAIAPAYAQFSINIAWAILLTAGVSFLGAGVRAPTAEWGLLISKGASDMMTGKWWVAFFPGLTLAICTLGFAMLADGLRDLSDPRKR